MNKLMELAERVDHAATLDEKLARGEELRAALGDDYARFDATYSAGAVKTLLELGLA